MDNDKKTSKKTFRRSILHKIINVFIGFFAFLLFALIIFFGFSQTKTFRDYLKNEISENVSSSTNGELKIGNIEGSIISSIILQNTFFISEKDTLFKADEITIKTSPIHLLLKRLLIRDLILKDVQIKLLEDKDGMWNYSKLSKSDYKEEKINAETDTSESTFPFSIQINNIDIQKLNFIRQTYPNINSERNYKFLTTSDLRMTELSLGGKLFLNISSSTARLNLSRFSVNPNFENFNLQNLSGEFEFTPNYASAKNFILNTDSSNIEIDARIEDLNLLGDVELKEFEEYPLSLKLQAFPINFSDLYTFIEDIVFLNDKVYLDLEAVGYFGDFELNKLQLSFLESYLSITGKVKELHTPEKLFLDVNIQESYIKETDAFVIIKGLDIPKYEDLKIENFNASFKGEPTKFNTMINGNIDDGNIEVDCYLDLQSEQMEYDVKYSSNDINLSSIIGLNSRITSSGEIKGSGTDPLNMKADLDIVVFNSDIDSIRIDSLYFQSKIDSKFLSLNLESIINEAHNSLTGTLDLDNGDEPIYNLKGNVRNLMLSNFTNNARDSSNLNLNFIADGQNLKLDKMNGQYEISLSPSYLRDLSLDETSIKLEINKNGIERNIRLASEFADFNIEGQFSLEKAIDILAYEGITISNIINDKLNELNPILESDSLIVLNQSEDIPDIAKEELEFEYSFLFKDFDLIAEFLDNDELDIVGYGNGSVKNDSLNFEITTDIYIDNLLNKKRDNIFYLSEIEATLNFSRDNRFESFNTIFGSVSIEGKKVYTGIEINDLISDFVFNQSKLFFNTSLSLEDNFSAEFEGTAVTSTENERIDISNFILNYKDIPWVNYDTCIVIFNDDGAQLSNLILNNGSTVIDFDAQINNDESHNFFINVEAMPGEVLSAMVFKEGTKPLKGDLNLNVTSTGFLKDPRINLDLRIFGVSYNNVNFGSLSCVSSHFNSNTLVDIDFRKNILGESFPLLSIDATLPLMLNYLNMEKILKEDANIDVAMRSNNFDLATFGNILPYIRDQEGSFSSAINITGPANNLATNGYFLLEGGRFISKENNLEYEVTVSTKFNEQSALFEEIRISNVSGTRNKGELIGNGEVILQQFPFSKFEFDFKGSLALLGRQSQSRNSTIYGDLLVKSDDAWRFSYNDEAYNFYGDVIIDKADLYYAPKQNSNYLGNNKIIYEVIEDTTKINLKNQKFVRILKETKNNSIDLSEENNVKFNINTNIDVRNIAYFNFLFSPELNQSLYIETTGRLKFETIGNETRTQGSLSLLEGSRLDFFKTFDATGTIRFENDITNPFFDIVATYIGEIEYFENTDRTEEVAVKLKLLSAFSDIKENLSENKQNLYVYVGRTQIENDVPDLRYDQSNALTFILFDQLSLNLDDNQRSALANLTGNAAFSILSSQLSSYVNNSLGGIISNIQLNRRSSDDAYKLLFSGKYNNIRYSFGGSFGSQTDYLQLSRADIKVEYLFNPNFLIRLEQKDPIIESSTDEKVQEVGLKYKFEF